MSATDLDKRLDRAQQLLQRNQVRPAVKQLRRILRDDPNHIEALDLLAQLALKHRKHAYARELLERAVKIWPRSARLHMNLGVAHHCLRDYAAAVERFQVALKHNREMGMVYYHLGLSLRALGRLNDAGHSFQRAILRMPEFVTAHEQLAKTMVMAEKHNAVLLVYKRILELDPNRSDVLVDLGNAFRLCKKDDDAILSFRSALQVNPKSIGALNNLGLALRDRGELREADQLIRRALELAPGSAKVHNSLGLSCERLGRIDEAQKAYHKAIELNPEHQKAFYNLGGLQTDLGRLADAEASYEKALSLKPDSPETRFRVASLKLLRGDFESGWGDYEQRWEMDESRGLRPAFEQPAWRGESIEGETLLVYAEQGFGDSFQFVRYLPRLSRQGARVLLQCHRRLVSLLSRVEGIDRVIPFPDKPDQAGGDGRPTEPAEPLPEFDKQVAMLSLPGLLGETVDTIPAERGYLRADPERVEKWAERLGGVDGLRVGICWQGKPSYVRDHLRSIPLDAFAPLADVPGVQLVSLQQGIGRKQLERFPQPERVLDLGQEMDLGQDGFEDTAAVIENLDLVITSDTSIAHLAGGLGATTWVALQQTPEWRWLLEREDSPWYPTVRLFRQPSFGDWAGVFVSIREALAALQPKA